MVVSSRRLDIRIRDLCARALTADDHNSAPILEELQVALHQHATQLREMALRQMAGPKKVRLRRREDDPCPSTLTQTND